MSLKKSHILIVIGLILQMVFYATMVVDNSTYDKYVSGEYYFRARAKTTQPEDSLLWDTSLDMTQTKNVLLLSSGAKVYAYNPHGQYATVDYGENTVQDFPLRRLKFLTEDDKDVFNGKKFTKEEYDDLIERIAADPSMEDMLSDTAMLPQKHSITYPVAVVFYSLVFGIILFALHDDEMWSQIILVFWVLLSILFDVIYANIM